MKEYGNQSKKTPAKWEKLWNICFSFSHLNYETISWPKQHQNWISKIKNSVTHALLRFPFLLNDISLSELSDSEQGDERLQKWKYYSIFIFHKPCACLAWIIVPWSCTKKSYILGESSSCFSISCQDFPYQGDKGTPPPISRKSAHAPHLEKSPPVDPTKSPPTTTTTTTKA